MTVGRIATLLFGLLNLNGLSPVEAAFFNLGAGIAWIPKSEELSKIGIPPATVLEKTEQSDAKVEGKHVYSILNQAMVIDPGTGKQVQAVDDALIGPPAWPFPPSDKKALVVLMSQLGDFDSFEYAEYLWNIMADLKVADIELRIIGIGNAKSAHMFNLFTGIPLENIRVDPTGSIHQSLGLHRGPDWDIPAWVPSNVLEWFAKDVCKNDNVHDTDTSREVCRSWLNYLAMYAGVSAPGTLQEIARGYFGDKSAPERLWPGEKVRAGPITIQGVTDVKIGPIEHQSLWKNEHGYLRPAELATCRLRSMSEVLPKFDHYVPDQRFLDWRGATFLLDEGSCEEDGEPIYGYINRGVLTYSETMDRPLSFLSNYIGLERARNPMGLADPEFVYN